MNTTFSRILVVGATGMLGRPVTLRLKDDGFLVRIMSRSIEKARAQYGREFEYAAADVRDPASLHAAMKDCQGVHINLKGGPRAQDFERVDHLGTRAILDAAKQHGVRHLTYLSGYTVGNHHKTIETHAKQRAEDAIKAGGIPFTIFRPTWFMESLPLFIQGRTALLVGKQPYPIRWLAAKDYARMVSRAYQLSSSTNRTLMMFGPQALTMRKALEQYCARVRPSVRVRQIPTWLMRAVGRLTFQPKLTSIASIFEYYERTPEQGDSSETDALLGAPTTTLKAWCEMEASSLAG